MSIWELKPKKYGLMKKPPTRHVLTMKSVRVTYSLRNSDKDKNLHSKSNPLQPLGIRNFSLNVNEKFTNSVHKRRKNRIEYRKVIGNSGNHFRNIIHIGIKLEMKGPALLSLP